MDLTGRHVAVIIYAGASSNPEDGVAAIAGLKHSDRVQRGGRDPVRSGLISSYNRPGGNITGIVPLNLLMGKHMGPLHELASPPCRHRS
jgi:putative tryptophan/tyrosine transport system substrate-binding protein